MKPTINVVASPVSIPSAPSAASNKKPLKKKTLDKWTSSYGPITLASNEKAKYLLNIEEVVSNMLNRCTKAILEHREKAGTKTILRTDHVFPRVYAVGKNDCLYRKGGGNALRVSLGEKFVTVTNGSDVTKRFLRPDLEASKKK